MTKTTSKRKTITKDKILPFEHVSKPLLNFDLFIQRQVRFTILAFSFLGICLAIGMVGYHFLGEMDWISAYHNATMILSGMGEIDAMPSNAAKIFSGSYALFSGVVFLSTIAVLFAPVVHRFLHRIHIEDPDDQE